MRWFGVILLTLDRRTFRISFPSLRFAAGEQLAAVVGELEADAEVAGAELAHDLLEDVFVLGDDADGVALDAGLDLELGP